MREKRLSSPPASQFSALEYREAGFALGAFELPIAGVVPAVEAAAVVREVAAEEVERRVHVAREAAIAETEERLRREGECVRQQAQQQITETLRNFEEERTGYFNRVEGEVVHLALAIARKILQRETELDPTLLAALVRIALDRMQCGPAVRIRVVSAEVERWGQFGERSGSATRWMVAADDELQPGDCVVETELGNANFGFEAQLRDVEETFAQLLAHKPDRA
jgi:flagellar assembly protein FliH